MALSQDDRISISKKILSTDQELAANAMNQIALDKRVGLLQKEDDGNKALMAIKSGIIQSYEDEIKFLDGSPRTVLAEIDYQNAVKKVVGNYLFPADNTTPIPSIPSGVWTKFTPFCLSGAIGLSYSEANNPVITNYEDLLLPAILTHIATLEGLDQVNVVTGQDCVVGVPPAGDGLVPDTVVQAEMAALISTVNTLVSVLNQGSAAISSNTDSANAVNLAAAAASISTVLSAINTWLAYPDFNPLPISTTCPIFNSYTLSLLAPTKGYSAQLTPFKNAITARSSFVTTRKSQISTVLGTVTQDLSTGYFLTTTGLYGERAKLINTRLNLMTGSLSKLNSANNGANALQQEAQSTIGNKDVLSQYLSVSKLSSVTNGTNFVTLQSASSFIVGQKAFIVSDTQQEIEVVIQAINGNSLQLNKQIPPTYRPTETARFYVDKTGA